MSRLPHDSPWWTLVLTAASVTACLIVYYCVPLPADDAKPVVQVVVFGAGVVLLCALLALQVRRQLRAWETPSVRVQSVMGLLLPVVTFFALAYYLMADQFEGIENRTDALYFAVVTLGTVGYGDVHPVGEAAKVVVMVQIALDLVVVGVLVSIATSRARARAERHRRVADAHET
ncbi:potassium channel family protein [Cellulosimicrobium protaetiae]|uniref:Two pore domain potassium channel family protein n=1 Tax=Cellulosimicrobium protaetiae TaxID=2587808 RepID=A0A6M5UJI7_9MICO|nr:potassium channel family protein [Cellulosimicrobium protaetiae]QJW37692.1 two pore domain potassium channel family protein [Cellulosimicrobium protaetiae]